MLEVPELEGIAQHQLIDEIGRMIIDSEMTLIPKIIFDFYLCAIAEVFDNQAALTAFKEEAYIQAKVMWRFSSSFEDISAMDAYFLGLFYHIGKLVLAIKNNRYLETEDNFQVSNLYNEAQKNHILITDFEVACFKTSHALVGYVIAEQLKLSEEILQAIANHHTHDFSTIGKSKVKSLIAMAQFVQNVVNHEIYDRPEDFEWEEHAETIVAELMLDDYTLDAFKSDVKEIAEQL
jgi:HD-like signal output (HDOD) protein